MNAEVIHTLLRSRLYAVLARGFSAPPREAKQWESQVAETGTLLAAFQELPGAVPVADALRVFQRATAAATDQPAIEAVTADYLELFVNLRSGAGIPPYETEYTGGSNDFFKNQQLADLMGFYNAFGVGPRGGDGFHERPDHIAVELEFFQFLVWKESRAREAGDTEHLAVCVEAEQAFLREHLGCWLEVFARAVEKTVGEGLYPALAKLLRAAVAWDANTLGVTLRPLSALPPRPPEPEPMTCGATDFVPLESLSPGGEP